MYNSINFSLISHGAANSKGDLTQVTAITTRIASLICPSSPTIPGTYYGRQIPGTCYFASVGSSLHWVGASQLSAPNGIFMYGGGRRQRADMCQMPNRVAFGCHGRDQQHDRLRRVADRGPGQQQALDPGCDQSRARRSPRHLVRRLGQPSAEHAGGRLRAS